MSASNNVMYVDAYIGTDIDFLFGLLRKNDGSNRRLSLLTRRSSDANNAALLEVAVRNFRSQGNDIELRYDTAQLFHDRFCVIDDSTVYNIGASLNAIPGARSTKSHGMFRLDGAELNTALSDIRSWWNQATVVT